MDTNKALTENLPAIRGTIAKALASRPDLIDDAIGDFMVHAITKVLPAYKDTGKASVKGWLTRAAKNFVIDELRRHRNHGHSSLNATGHSTSDDGAADGIELSASALPLNASEMGNAASLDKASLTAVLARDDQRRLDAAIAALGGDDRELVTAVLAGERIAVAGASVGLTPVQSTRRLKAIQETLARKVR